MPRSGSACAQKPHGAGAAARADALHLGLGRRLRSGAHGDRQRRAGRRRGWLHVEKRALERDRPARRATAGLIVANPPYGERIGAESGLPALYSELGAVLREQFQGWQAAILTGNPPLASNLGLYAKRTHRVLQRHHRVPSAALRS